MEVIYTIHSNLEHCSVSVNNTDYSYYSLKDLLKPRIKEFLKKSKSKSKKKNNSAEIIDVAEKFEKTNLTQDEIKNYFFKKKESKAKSWFSSQRRLRKNGKLEKHKIDALNSIGMLWNPKLDNWEKNYILFKQEPIVQILKKMKKKKYYISRKDINDIIEMNHWIKDQCELYKDNKLGEENLTRLNAINFSFIHSSESDDNKLTITRLISLILRIEELSSLGAQGVASMYNLEQKIYIGGNVKINENIIEKNIQIDKTEEVDKNENEYSIEAEKEFKLAKKKAIKILDNKSTDYFIKQIDKKCRKRGSNLWSSYTRYSVNYSDLNYMLSNSAIFSKITIDNVVHKPIYCKYNFNDSIKIYTAKKMIEILDKYLLKTGHLNDKKTFRPISFLMNLYKKNKNIEGLIYLKEIIEKHQLLTLIYSDRLNKIISKYV